MLNLHSSLTGVGGGDSRLSAVPAPDRFCFAGVGFELLWDGAQSQPLPVRLRPYCTPAVPGGELAEVVCALRVDHCATATPHSLAVTFEATHEGARITARDFNGELVQTHPRRYLLSGQIRPDLYGWAALLRGVSAAVAQRSGGASLHAVGVEVGGRAVLFTGPSGSGKSTASRHMGGASILCDDHVMLLPRPDGGGWQAWGVPHMGPQERMTSSFPHLPLAGILRVRRGTPSVSIRPLDGTGALFTLRQSLEMGLSAAADRLQHEPALLDSLLALSAQVPVADINTVLGQDNLSTVVAWLEG